jgi:small subunit ribosomal protein S6
MPKYEMMYIMASGVSDDQAPAVAESIKKIVSDFGGTNIEEQQLGKKKLAYPIGKTRNGYYVVVNFTMDGKKVNDLDAKIRTMDSTIIRYLLINQEEHLERTKKDAEVQAKMNKNRTQQPAPASETPAPKADSAPAPKIEAAPSPVQLEEIDEQALDKKIEEALSEDITK